MREYFKLFPCLKVSKLLLIFYSFALTSVRVLRIQQKVTWSEVENMRYQRMTSLEARNLRPQRCRNRTNKIGGTEEGISRDITASAPTYP
jgi:hypothetical protein